jgi:hypothetical protein
LVENATGEKIATLHTDNGGEFISNEFHHNARKKELGGN